MKFYSNVTICLWSHWDTRLTDWNRYRLSIITWTHSVSMLLLVNASFKTDLQACYVRRSVRFLFLPSSYTACKTYMKNEFWRFQTMKQASCLCRLFSTSNIKHQDVLSIPAFFERICSLLNLVFAFLLHKLQNSLKTYKLWSVQALIIKCGVSYGSPVNC